MKGLRKKAVVLAAVTAFAMSSLAGCSKDYSVDNNKVAVVVGDSEITLGALNFYLRYDQSNVEEAYAATLGENFWRADVETDFTFEEYEKENIISAMAQMYILEDHMSEMGVELTADHLAKIEAAADAFIAANTDGVSKLVSGDRDVIIEVLKKCTISVMMYNEIIKDVSTEVSDFEAAQKRLAYVGFMETENITLEGAIEEANLLLEEAMNNGSLVEVAEAQDAPVYEYTFDSNTTSIAKEIVEAADKLKEGEFAELVQVDDKYYVVQLISEFDEEATDAKKEEIVANRQNEKFEEVYKPWQDATVIAIDDKVVEDISLHGLKVKALVVE